MGHNRNYLNEKQQDVLAWIADGCPPSDHLVGYQHRITARALESRGLVTISGQGASWEAEITPAGKAWRPPVVPANRARTEGSGQGERRAKESRVPIPMRLAAVHPAIATFLQDKDWLFVTTAHLPRATRLLQAIAEEADRRGFQVIPPLPLGGEELRVSRVRNKPPIVFDISLKGRRFGVTIKEISQQGGGKTEPSAAPSRHPTWQYRRTWKFVSTGRLEVSCCGSYRDERWVPLDSKLDDLFRDIDKRTAQLDEHDRHREDEEAARHRRWDEAVQHARKQYEVEARFGPFRDLAERSILVDTQRAFLVAARRRLVSYNGDDREAIADQLDYAERHLDVTDPLNDLSSLVVELRESRPEELRPFLKGWSPYGPSSY